MDSAALTYTYRGGQTCERRVHKYNNLCQTYLVFFMSRHMWVVQGSSVYRPRGVHKGADRSPVGRLRIAQTCGPAKGDPRTYCSFCMITKRKYTFMVCTRLMLDIREQPMDVPRTIDRSTIIPPITSPQARFSERAIRFRLFYI